MSFRASANHVRNTELPIWRRLCALRSCIVLLRNLSGEGYRATVQRYDTLYGLNRYHPQTNPPTEAQLLATLEALEAERNVLIAAHHDKAQRNRETKLARKEAQRRDAPSYLFGMPCTTAARLQRAIAKPKVTLVFIGASWDTNSTRLGLFLSQWKVTSPPRRLLVVNVDDPQHWDFLHERGIQTTPTLLVFRQSQELARRFSSLPQQGTTQEHLTALQDWFAGTLCIGPVNQPADGKEP